jgi:pimeloyl-ACP methyl ester carboxylesterase
MVARHLLPISRRFCCKIEFRNYKKNGEDLMPNFKYKDLDLFYREVGEGKLLLILPGNTATSVCHCGDLKYFGSIYRAVSMDFPGTGKSSRLDEWTADWWEQNAEAAAELIFHLGASDCCVIGTSGGANTALLLAVKYPDLVSGVIADSCVERYSPEQLLQEVADRARRTEDQVAFWSYANGPDWEEVLEADNQLLLKLADRGGEIYHGRLSEITCPVLLTGSLVDSSLPDLGQQYLSMAGKIPECSLFLHNHGDHPLIWTAPEAFRAAASRFLKLINNRG